MASSLPPPEAPDLDDLRLLRQVGFRNAPHRIDRSPLAQAGGAAPPWLVGLHYRLSPGLFSIDYMASRKPRWPFGPELIERKERTFGHLFDAIPILQRFEFTSDGSVYYSSGLLGSRVVEAWEAARGKAPSRSSKELAQVLYSSVGWGRGASGRSKRSYLIPARSRAAVIGTSLTAGFPMGDYHGQEGRLVLHQEALPILQEVDQDRAGAKDLFSYSALNPDFFGTPCPKPLRDPLTGELVNVLAEFSPTDAKWIRYRVIAIPERTEAEESATAKEAVTTAGRVIARFKAPPTLIRSFGLTRDHIVIPLFPLRFRPREHQPSVFREGGLIDGLYDRLAFDGGDDTLFYVINRHQGHVQAVYRSEATFAWNVVNAFDSGDGDSIHLDVCAYHDDRIIDALGLGMLRNPEPFLPIDLAHLRRYHLGNLKAESAVFFGSAGQMTLFPTASFHLLHQTIPMEAPCISPAVLGQQHQFVYGLGCRKTDQEKRGVFWNALVKANPLYPHEVLNWSQPGAFPSPPVFIPRPDGQAEDDGIVLSQVLDVLRKRSFLLLLDARDWSERGRWWLPVAVSPSPLLDGIWLQSALGPRGVEKVLAKEEGKTEHHKS